MQKPLDLVCFYADLGRPYLPLIRRMMLTARAVMPESRMVLITTTPGKELERGFDVVMVVKTETTPQTLCLDKVRSMLTWQAQMDRPCAFVDPDLEFKRPIQMIDEDVGVLWRQRSAQPVNAGMLLAKPGCPDFWRKYGVTAAMLPVAIHGWWCDQLALSVMLGALRKPGDVVQAHDARVRLIPQEDACAPPEKAHAGTWAHHFKGRRKGPGWETMFPGDPRDARSIAQ